MQQPPRASARVVSLRQVFNDYLMVKDLKDHTRRNYTRRITGHLSDWLDMPITDISMRMVEDRHRLITAQNGKTIGNDVFRTLRALMQFATYEYSTEDEEPYLKRNPVQRLSHLRAWNRMTKRKGVIYPSQLKAWVQAVFSLQNVHLRDFLLLLLFTGLRHAEARCLEWSQVDLANGVIHLVDTKNGLDADIPMSDYVWDMLKLRSFGARGKYVFPGRNPNKPLTFGSTALQVIRRRSGVQFIPHDLRRTFISIGDEAGIDKETRKVLVNHTEGDVHDDYTVRSLERLRRATQAITNCIRQHAGMMKPR